MNGANGIGVLAGRAATGPGPAGEHAGAVEGPRGLASVGVRGDTAAVGLYALATAASAFIVSDPIYLVAMVVGVLVVIRLTGHMPACRPWLGVASASALMAILLNPVFSREGVTVLVRLPSVPVLGGANVTAEAIAFGVAMGLRLFVLIMLAAWWTVAADPDEALRLVARWSFRSAVLAALATRLFPTLVADTARIMDAQRSRGLRLDAPRRLDRIRAIAPVMDAVLLSSLERAMGLAGSMESRGFGRGRRTRMPSPPRRWSDVWVIVAAGSIVAFSALAASGPGRLDYYPALVQPADLADLVLAPTVLALVLVPGLVWRRWRSWPSSR